MPYCTTLFIENTYLDAEKRVIVRSGNYTQQKRSAQVGVRKEIIYQQLDAFQTEIQGSLMKLCAFKASLVHPSKVVKLSITTPGAGNMDNLNNP